MTMHRGPRGTVGTLVALVAALAVALSVLVAPATASARAAKPLRISGIGVQCECGGAGYLWGWRVVAIQFAGFREGRTYRVAVKGGPTAEAQWNGYASISQAEAHFKPGKVYRFRVQEYDGRRMTRSTPWQRYRIPKPVGHPTRAHLESTTLDGQEVFVAGRTYRLTFDGDWQQGIRFASGVDRYRGTEAGDDRFGYYEEDDYPLPWSSSSASPIVEFTPSEEMAGTTWSIQVVGYRPAEATDKKAGVHKGDPVRGSEWGYWFEMPVVASDAAGVAGD